jgi:glutathione peroxidase-family protein
MSQFHTLNMADINGQEISFTNYKDKVCLVVNLASR